MCLLIWPCAAAVMYRAAERIGLCGSATSVIGIAGKGQDARGLVQDMRYRH